MMESLYSHKTTALAQTPIFNFQCSFVKANWSLHHFSTYIWTFLGGFFLTSVRILVLNSVYLNIEFQHQQSIPKEQLLGSTLQTGQVMLTIQSFFSSTSKIWNWYLICHLLLSRDIIYNHSQNIYNKLQLSCKIADYEKVQFLFLMRYLLVLT